MPWIQGIVARGIGEQPSVHGACIDDNLMGRYHKKDMRVVALQCQSI